MEKINIAELLKDCPSGMELDCTIVDGLYFDKVTENNEIKCYSKRFYESTSTCNSICFYSDGSYLNHTKAKCVIFPKGKTTWEGFVPPCKFKDGDMIYNRLQKKICIYYLYEDKVPRIRYCRYNESNVQLQFEKLDYPIPIAVQDYRLATEEEKQKLFDAIKANGYKWNAETKTLEKLVEPKFKVGNKVKYKNGKNIDGVEQGVILSITDDTYDVAVTNDMGIFVSIADQDDWELVLDIKPKFKVGNIIQDKNGYKVRITDVDIEKEYYVYESLTINGIGGISFNRQDEWELAPNKFDITTLKPFESRVLVRDYDNRMWIPTFWGKRLEDYSNCRYLTTNGCYRCCIPYEQNEHLLGTTNDCDEFYKTWEL